MLAQDPDLTGPDGVVTAKVRVPNDVIEPGPRSHRFHVIDYDSSRQDLQEPVSADHDIQPPADLGRVERDNGFRAQNVFAIAARTLDAFESALGRRVAWGFDGHQLHLIPRAMNEANAFYSEDDRAILFGYVDDDKGTVFTSLSHDIVAHETTHAVLDGLRDRYDTPGLPDQAAFHEAFADIVALLSAFAMPERVRFLLGAADDDGRIRDAAIAPPELARTFSRLATQLGRSSYGRASRGLRNSVELMDAVGAEWVRDTRFEEPHRRGEVLVAAVMRSLAEIWSGRLQALRSSGRLDRERTVEEGAKAAAHLLKMSMRALDYCPPLEFEFGDFLDALLVSDEEVEPDDLHHYRDSLQKAFAALGITPAEGRIYDYTKTGSGGPELTYDGFNYVLLRSDPNEVFGFMWRNRDALGLDLSLYTRVDDVRSAVRIGSNGFVVTNVLADYVQEIEGPRAELERRLKLDLGTAVPADTLVKLYGGGVVVFDQFGRVRYHQSKALALGDIAKARQLARLQYLDRVGRTDTRGRFGFSDGASAGQRYARFHLEGGQTAEVW